MTSDDKQGSICVIEPEGLPPDDFKGPEFKIRYKTRSHKRSSRKVFYSNDVPQILSSPILCTACNKQVNPFAHNSIFSHPVLNVLLCKACYDYYHSGEFDKDEEGIDNYCRWCGKGGSVTLCDDCSNVFCRSCIRRHLSRTESKRIETQSWSCFVCDPTPIRKNIQNCKMILAAVNSFKKSPIPNVVKKNKPKSTRCLWNESTEESGSSDYQQQKNKKQTVPKQNQEGKKVETETNHVSDNQRRSAMMNGAAKRKHPIQTWKEDCLRDLINIQEKISSLSRQFQAHFAEENDALQNEKPMVTSNFTKMKTVNELKVEMEKVQSQSNAFLTAITSKRSQLRSIAEQGNSQINDDSTTAKETDSDTQSLSTPSKKKILKKRKDLDNARASSSNETETSTHQTSLSKQLYNGDVNPSVHKQASKEENTNEVNNKHRVNRITSTELSDTGSSKMYGRQHAVEDMAVSGASISDIFDHQDSKHRGSATFHIPLDSEILTDDNESEVLFKPQLPKNASTPSQIFHKDSSVVVKEEVCSGDTTELEDTVFRQTKKTFQQKDKDQQLEKKEKSDCASSSPQSFSDVASDDQLLPSPSNSVGNLVRSSSDSSFMDAGMAEKVNMIALSNLENQRLSLEQEDDEDIDDLLQQDDIEKSKSKRSATDVDASSNWHDDDDVSEDEEKKKPLYRNPLLNIRLSLSDCEKSSKRETNSSLKRKRTGSDSDQCSKKMRNEFKMDEALGDPCLSDEDVLLLNAKDEEIDIDGYKASDVDVLLSDDECKENSKSENAVDQSEDVNVDVVEESEQDDEKESREESSTSGDTDCDKTNKKPGLKNTQSGSSSNKNSEDVSVISLEANDDNGDKSFGSQMSDDKEFPVFTIGTQKKKETINDVIKREILSSDEEFNHSAVPLRPKKRRRKLLSDSECDERIEIDDSSPDEENSQFTEGGKLGRKNIRKILDDENLSQVTKEAEKMEMQRRKRLEENDDDEVIIIEDTSSPQKIASRLILSKNPLVEVDPSVVCKLKDHQIDGIKFLWKNVIETVGLANKDPGNGCLLAHCMGLGKTLQVIAFLHTVLTSSHMPSLRSTLVICPLSTLSNWVKELRMWLKSCKNKLEIYSVDKVSNEGAYELMRWHRRGGVAVIGYCKYRSICARKSKTLGEPYWKMYLQALQDPGPDIVVCDEGHLLKNVKTSLSSVVEGIKTSRRIVLTGTPLQNNLMEYHCMVSFIKPGLLGTKKEFSNRFVNPILNGQHVDSTKRDVHLMKKRSHVLHELLAGCVQRRDVECLRKHLMPKFEYVLFVRLSPLQIRLYEHYMKAFKCNELQKQKGKLFQDFNNFLLIVAHPRALQLSKARADNKVYQDDIRNFIDDDDDDDEEEEDDVEDDAISENGKTKIVISESMAIPELKRIIKEHGGNAIGCIDKNDLIKRARSVVDPDANQDNTEEGSWFESIMPTQEKLVQDREHSGKILLLLEIIRIAGQESEKVVVFSQSLLTLDLIELYLKEDAKQRNASNDFQRPFSWRKEYDYFRLDGSIPPQKRKNFIDQFNNSNNRRARLFLISTKAGGVGINLIGANRAVLFDAGWNPTHDVQSIFRIYRFGQTKPCYVYRLISQGTMEEKIYERQVVKQSLAFRVVDEQQIERHFTANDIAELYQFKPKKLQAKSKENSTPHQAPPKDKLLANLLLQISTRDAIVSFHEHDSLLDHQADEELTEEERQIAWDEYDRERHPPVKEGDPLLKLPCQTVKDLISETEKELSRNGKMLEKFKETSLDVLMLHLKLNNRDLTIEKQQEYALQIQINMMGHKQRLINTRTFLNQKLEQLRYCAARSIPSAPNVGNVPTKNLKPNHPTTTPSAVPPQTSQSSSTHSHLLPPQYAPPNPANHYENNRSYQHRGAYQHVRTPRYQQYGANIGSNRYSGDPYRPRNAAPRFNFSYINHNLRGESVPRNDIFSSTFRPR